MANSKSAAKRARMAERRRVYNKSIKSSVKTSIRSFLGAVEDGETENAHTLYNTAASRLDRAAKRGIIHPNLAARKKSRLAQKLNKLA